MKNKNETIRFDCRNASIYIKHVQTHKQRKLYKCMHGINNSSFVVVVVVVGRAAANLVAKCNVNVAQQH